MWGAKDKVQALISLGPRDDFRDRINKILEEINKMGRGAPLEDTRAF
jgi:hypothetical protein